LIVLKLVGARAVRHFRAGDIEKSAALYRRYVKVFPRQPHGRILLSGVLVDMPGKALEEREALLREGVRLMPHHPGMVEHLAAFYLFRCYESGDESFALEGDEVIAEHEDLLGPSVLSHLWWSERAQDANEMALALDRVDQAFEIARHHRDPNLLFQIGAGLASIPGQTGRAVELMEEAAAKVKNVQHFALLAQILEAAGQMERAEMWRARGWAVMQASGATADHWYRFLDGVRQSFECQDRFRAKTWARLEASEAVS
jgi:hypothetical protein